MIELGFGPRANVSEECLAFVTPWDKARAVNLQQEGPSTSPASFALGAVIAPKDAKKRAPGCGLSSTGLDLVRVEAGPGTPL